MLLALNKKAEAQRLKEEEAAAEAARLEAQQQRLRDYEDYYDEVELTQAELDDIRGSNSSNPQQNIAGIAAQQQQQQQLSQQNVAGNYYRYKRSSTKYRNSKCFKTAAETWQLK